MTIFPPDWSVSTEWFFYLIFPPAALLLARIVHPLRALTVLLVGTTIVLGVLFQYKDFLVSVFTPLVWRGDKVSAGVWLWIIYFCPYIRVLEFLSGALAARAYISVSGVRPDSSIGRVVIGLCVGWCVIIIFLPGISDNWFLGNLVSNFIFAPALAPLLYLCCRYDTWLSRALSSPPMLFMGKSAIRSTSGPGRF